jgi:hypothetical protein
MLIDRGIALPLEELPKVLERLALAGASEHKRSFDDSHGLELPHYQRSCLAFTLTSGRRDHLGHVGLQRFILRRIGFAPPASAALAGLPL